MNKLSTAVKTLEKLYPLEYAERSWDNVGLLVDSYTKPIDAKFKILLTIDVTQSVCDEAVAKGASLIVAYHPFIFRGLKSIVPSKNSQQKSLVKLIQNHVSVYSPHTAVDAAPQGVNAWLADGLLSGGDSFAENKVIETNAANASYGMGRFVEFAEPQKLDDVVAKIKQSLGIKHVQVARAHGSAAAQPVVKTVGICAGSGAGVFAKLPKLPDLLYTGELSHHEVLAFKESGASVVLCNHSNTERGYLKQMKSLLEKELDSGYEIEISEEDRDPLQFE